MSSEYEVGYGKPPKHTRFKPGQSGNLKGRPKTYKSAISVLEEPLNMKVGGKKREVPAFEASLRKTAQSALEGQLPAIKRFFKHCDEAGLLIDRNKPPTHGVIRPDINPADYPDRDWTEDELAEINHINKTQNQRPPPEPPTEKEAIIMRVAGEKHLVESLGRRLTVFDLIQQKLRHRALVDRHEPSHAFFEKMLTRTTLDLEQANVGFLVAPPLTPAWLSVLRVEIVDD